MVKLIFKKMVLFYIALSLAGSPVELLAAQKKSQKRIYSTQKSSVGKYRVKNSKAYKVRHKSRYSRAVSLDRRAFLAAESYDGSGALQLASNKALVVNQNTGEVIFAKNTDLPSAIASISKLMTAMVVLDAKLSLDDQLYISDEDVDYYKGTSSRLAIGTGLTRGDMLQLALMASENRAASALARHYPGGSPAFIKAMNFKAYELGLTNTHFEDATGLNSNNVSTAEDLVKMVQAAYQYPEIRLATTSPSHDVYVDGRDYPVSFVNTNGLVRAGEWEIGLSKTGFITEAGRCLVMQAKIADEPVIIVLLDSNGKLSRIGDATRVRKWMEYNHEYRTTKTGQTDTLVAGKIS